MRKATAALACLLSALALTGSAAGITYGVADDTGKYADDGGAAFFSSLRNVGMTENRMAVMWDPAHPTTITEQAFLDRAVPQAVAHGIEPIFAIYPAKARALVDTPNGIQLFAQYAAKVAERYPYVRKFICLNEGNQPRFHQPQFDDAGNAVAGAVQEAAMAACYDALKGVNPNIDVIGFGFSPRGNDDFDATSNVSRSPILFVKDIGDAYRKSGRTLPIADDVSIHCHPNANTDAPSVGFSWPNAGCANLDRFKQAWWDAFHGTGQAVFQETGPHATKSSGPFVRLFVDEAGYQAQIPASKAGYYSGSENVKPLDEATQGEYYSQLVSMVACDPNVALLNLFHLVDQSAAHVVAPTEFAPTRAEARDSSGQGGDRGEPELSRASARVGAYVERRRRARGLHRPEAVVRPLGRRRLHVQGQRAAGRSHGDVGRGSERGRIGPLQAPVTQGRGLPRHRARERPDESGSRHDVREDLPHRDKRSRITPARRGLPSSRTRTSRVGRGRFRMSAFASSAVRT